MDKHYDLIIIGGGPAGYSAAVKASNQEKKVLLIEKEKLGGTCLNRGCIPTKYLWEVVNLGKKIKKAGSFGISAEIKELTLPVIQDKNRKNIEVLVKGLQNMLKLPGVEIIEGAAEFSTKNTIILNSSDENKSEIKFKNLIIATGSVPKDLPGVKIDHNKVIDSTDALNLTEVPRSMLIIGGGAIGIEMAGIFSSLGTDIAIIEKENNLLPGEDIELAEEIKKNLVRSGVSVTTGAEATEEITGKYEKILLVIGRKPNTEGLGLEKAGIKYSKKGIIVNEFLETSLKGVYAAGDVNGNAYFAYTAEADGIISAENIFGGKIKADYSAIPRVVFSNPPCASVGSVKDNKTISTGKYAFIANARASIEGERSGWVKISALKSTGEIVSGQIIGAKADEMVQLLSIAVRRKLKLEDLKRELFFHPCFSEAIFAAAESVK